MDKVEKEWNDLWDKRYGTGMGPWRFHTPEYYEAIGNITMEEMQKDTAKYGIVSWDQGIFASQTKEGMEKRWQKKRRKIMTDEKNSEGMRYPPKDNFASMKMTKEEVEAVMAKIPTEEGHITEFYSGPYEWHQNKPIKETFTITGPMSDPIYKSLMDLNDAVKKENSKYESEKVMPDKQGNLTQDEIVRMMRGFVPDQKKRNAQSFGNTGVGSMFKEVINKQRSEYGSTNEISDSDLKEAGLIMVGSLSLLGTKMFINHKHSKAYKNQLARGDNQEVMFYTVLVALVTVADILLTHRFRRLMQK